MGLTLHLRGSRKDLYIPCTMTSNNREWDKAWFYLRNDAGQLLAYTGRVLTEEPSAKRGLRCIPTRCAAWQTRV